MLRSCVTSKLDLGVEAAELWKGGSHRHFTCSFLGRWEGRQQMKAVLCFRMFAELEEAWRSATLAQRCNGSGCDQINISLLFPVSISEIEKNGQDTSHF